MGYYNIIHGPRGRPSFSFFWYSSFPHPTQKKKSIKKEAFSSNLCSESNCLSFFFFFFWLLFYCSCIIIRQIYIYIYIYIPLAMVNIIAVPIERICGTYMHGGGPSFVIMFHVKWLVWQLKTLNLLMASWQAYMRINVHAMKNINAVLIPLSKTKFELNICSYIYKSLYFHSSKEKRNFIFCSNKSKDI
jgi:hypothetical protein